MLYGEPVHHKTVDELIADLEAIKASNGGGTVVTVYTGAASPEWYFNVGDVEAPGVEDGENITAVLNLTEHFDSRELAIDPAWNVTRLPDGRLVSKPTDPVVDGIVEKLYGSDD